jgi:sirohydrochlorin ferrochelatase
MSAIRHPDRPTAVLLIAHGSRRPEANQDLFELAERLAAARVQADAGPPAAAAPIVQASFLELAEPDILGGGGLCVERGAGLVLMIPYFLSAGVHLRRDLAAARDELAGRHPDVEFRLGPPLGPHPLLDALVADRIRQTGDEPDA